MEKSNPTTDHINEFATMNIDNEHDTAIHALHPNSSPCPTDENTIIAKIITTKTLNMNAFKAAMLKAWKPDKKATTNSLGDNTMAFVFEEEEDMEKILNQAWTFRDHQLAVVRWPPDQAHDEVNLNIVTLWVHAFGVPVSYTNMRSAKVIGDEIVRFIKTDLTNVNQKWKKSIRMQVEIDIQKPLKSALTFSCSGRPKLQIGIRYERLIDFCYSCGLIGHKLANCHNSSEGRQKEIEEECYGPWMKSENFHIPNPKFIRAPCNSPNQIQISPSRYADNRINPPVTDISQTTVDNTAEKGEIGNIQSETSDKDIPLSSAITEIWNDLPAKLKKPSAPPGFPDLQIDTHIPDTAGQSLLTKEIISPHGFGPNNIMEFEPINITEAQPFLKRKFSSLSNMPDPDSTLPTTNLNPNPITTQDQKRPTNLSLPQIEANNLIHSESLTLNQVPYSVNYNPNKKLKNSLTIHQSSPRNDENPLLAQETKPNSIPKDQAILKRDQSLQVVRNSLGIAHIQKYSTSTGEVKNIETETELGSKLAGPEGSIDEDEKMGGLPFACSSVNNLSNNLNKLELIDLGFVGHPFTWNNKRSGVNNIQQRLDRGVGNMSWLSSYPLATIHHLIPISSYHCPIILSTLPEVRSPSPFRFENMWMSDSRIWDVVAKGWNIKAHGSPPFKMTTKIKNVKKELKTWNSDVFGNCHTMIKELKEKVYDCQKQVITDSNEALEKDLLLELDLWLARAESHWKQKAKDNWLKEGDSNTR
ncbi:hypothetical protein CASFOL_014203 [Castilleja foliolosa]|uniref:CCHC-type domain-containing protein n=1 Tax=Castilleja foliolosa TaxID=1961234 RepID=A0ABD3DM70_9LAMI